MLLPNLSMARNVPVEGIVLGVLLVVLFLAYNYINLSGNRWTLHPDDHDALIFSQVLSETGHLWYDSPLNTELNTWAFIPSITDYISTPRPPNQVPETQYHGLSGWHSPGFYLFLYTGYLLGSQGPFIIISIAAIVIVLFVYLITEELWSKRAGLVAAAMVGFSPPVVYWANMLFSNILALSIYLGGIYFLIRYGKTNNIKFGMFWVLFFGMAVWIRNDFIFHTGLAAALFWIVALIQGWPQRRHLPLLILSGAALCVLVLTFNYATTLSASGITRGEVVSTSIEHFWKYPLRAFWWGVLWTNLKMHLLNLAPVIAIAAPGGAAVVIFGRPNVYGLILMFLGIFTLFYYGKNADYFGFDKSWLAASYTRYFLPAFIVMGIFFAIWLESISGFLCRRVLGGYLALALTVIFIGGHIAFSAYLLHNMAFGLTFTYHQAGDFRRFNALVDSLAPNAVLVDATRRGFFKKIITSRTVLYVDSIQDEQIPTVVPNLVQGLHQMGYTVYVLEEERRDIINLQSLILSRFPEYSFQKVSVPLFRYDAPFNLYLMTPTQPVRQ